MCPRLRVLKDHPQATRGRSQWINASASVFLGELFFMVPRRLPSGNGLQLSTAITYSLTYFTGFSHLTLSLSSFLYLYFLGSSPQINPLHPFLVSGLAFGGIQIKTRKKWLTLTGNMWGRVWEGFSRIKKCSRPAGCVGWDGHCWQSGSMCQCLEVRNGGGPHLVNH